MENSVESTCRIYSELEKMFDLKSEDIPESMIEIDFENQPDDKEAGYLIAKPREELTLGRKFRYDEWDFSKQEYKEKFVQVSQTDYPDVKDNNYVRDVIQNDVTTVKNLRRIFESLSPQGFVVVNKQVSGDIDYDMLCMAKAEQAAGITPSEKIYTREYKNNRSVASIVLSENSGSLRKFIDIKNPDVRLLDIIKKAQIYFSEAISMIGDRYALASFSGETEKNVEFYIIKDFDQDYGENVKRTIGSIRPLQQNRDGAGIRHATHLLSNQPESTKLLFYLMEGVPHDFSYEGKYAIEDTKKAIIEVKKHGCIPIVIASGINLSDDIRSISNHCIYREISDPRLVPYVLPNLYKRITL